MTDTRVLLTRIAALRQRMEQAHGKTAPAGQDQPAEPGDRVRLLESQIALGNRYGALLDGSFRPLEETAGPTLPRQLTARARRLLLAGQGLLAQLRGLADHFTAEAEATEPLAGRYRDTVAMLDTALRTVQAYPDAPSVQLGLCDGLEAILGVVAERTAVLKTVLEQKLREADRVNQLAEALLALASDRPVEIGVFVNLAEDLVADLEQGAPLRFFQAGPPPANATAEAGKAWLARTVACHGLVTAQVVARLVQHDPDLRSQPLHPVLAALVHDVGMVQVPLALYTQTGPLDEEQRRTIEGHTRLGYELVTRLLPTAGWLAEAAATHHERLDGTGYPSGLREMQIAPLVRLLAVCDVYATLCVDRPHRPAREPRTALTDTLLLADKGALDRGCAERLLELSFYPVGSLVELADGALGLVVATPSGRHDLTLPARPVIVLLADAQGQWLPVPRHVNLAESEGRTVVRTLLAEERRRVLGKRYPELA